MNNLIQSIAKSKTSALMLLTSTGMGFTLAVDILLAARFGTSALADSIIIAITLPIFLETILRDGTRFSLLSTFSSKALNEPESQFNSFVVRLFNTGIILGLILLLIVELFSPLIVQIIGPGLSVKAQSQATMLLRLLAPLLLLYPATTVLSAYLNSKNYFNVVGLRNLIVTVTAGIMLGFFWTSQNAHLGYAGGVLAGTFIYISVLIIQSWRLGMFAIWQAFITRGDFAEIRGALAWPTLSMFILQIAALVEKMIASTLAIGGVAAFYYVRRIVSGIQTIVGISVALTGLPRLTKLTSNKNAFFRIIRKNVQTTTFIALPISIILMIFNVEVISFIFAHGEFDNVSTEMSSKLLFYISFGLIFTCINPILSSALIARRKFKLFFLKDSFVAITWIINSIVLTFVWGLIGLAIAFSITSLIGVLTNSYLLKREFKRDEG